MRFISLIFVIIIIAVVGGGVFLGNADIAPPKETIELEIMPQTAAPATQPSRP